MEIGIKMEKASFQIHFSCRNTPHRVYCLCACRHIGRKAVYFMEYSLGQKISELRRASNITQEKLAEKMGVSPQAVSKWETGQTCPDIMLLRDLSATLGVTVDELLSPQKIDHAVLVPDERRKKAEDMLLRVVIHSAEGDDIKLNLPLSLLTALIEAGISPDSFASGSALKNVDFDKIIRLAQAGVAGQLIEIKDADGDTISISLE